MDKVTRASRRDDFIGAMYSIIHFYLPLPWYSKVLDKDEAINHRQEYGKFYIITRAWTVEKKGFFNFFQNLIITPSGDFKQDSEGF